MPSQYQNAHDSSPSRWDLLDQLFDTAFTKRPLDRDHDYARSSLHTPVDDLERHNLHGAAAPEPETPDHCSDISTTTGPPTPPDYEYIDQIWAEVRRFKQRELAKEKSKIKSLEAPAPDRGLEVSPARHGIRRPSPARVTTDPSRRPTVKFRATSDRHMMTAIFDMTGVSKKDVHISYQAHQLVVTWSMSVPVSVRRGDRRAAGEVDFEATERLVRYGKTIVLPSGTKFEQVHAGMDGKNLIVRYPNRDEENRIEAADAPAP